MNRWFKYICFTFIITVSLFFIGINNTKALGEPDGNGNAVCTYSCSHTTSTGLMSKDASYVMSIIVYRNTDGVYVGYADVNAQNLGIQGFDVDDGTGWKFEESSYNTIFNDSSKLKENFYSGNKWGCPDAMYGVYKSSSKTIEIYYNHKIGSDKCNVKDESFQEGFSGETTPYQTVDDNGRIIIGEESSDDDEDDELSQIAAAYKMCYFTEDKDGNIQYYDKDGNEIEKEDYEENCAGLTEIKCDIISDNISEFLNHLFWVISIAGILLLVIMTMVEFIKALTGSDDSGLIKGFKHTLIRIIAVIILLLLPTILTALLNLVNKYSTYKIGEDGSVTCGIGVNK